MLKLFFSSGKGWLEESVLKNVGVIPTNLRHGRNEFYYNGDRIVAYHMPLSLSEATQHSICCELVNLVKLNKDQMLIYHSSEVFLLLKSIVKDAGVTAT